MHPAGALRRPDRIEQRCRAGLQRNTIIAVTHQRVGSHRPVVDLPAQSLKQGADFEVARLRGANGITQHGIPRREAVRIHICLHKGEHVTRGGFNAVGFCIQHAR